MSCCAAGEDDGPAAEILDRGVGLLLERDPVAAVVRAAADLAGKEQGGGVDPLGVDHVGGTEVAQVDGAVGETLQDDGGGERDDDLDGPAQPRTEEIGEAAALLCHEFGVFVGFERDDDPFKGDLGRGGCVLGPISLGGDECQEQEKAAADEAEGAAFHRWAVAPGFPAAQKV